MGSIAKRPDGTYRARYRDLGGREHAKHFTRRKDAKDWLDEVAGSLTSGTYVDPRKARTTVGEVADLWLASSPDWTASTRARNESIVKNHIRPKWGRVKLVDVEYEPVQKWVQELAKGKLAARTVVKIVSVLSSILDLAIVTGRAKANPAKQVKTPKGQVTRRRYLPAGQVEAMATAAGDQGDVVMTLAYCGLRIGELAALRIRHLDQVRRRLRIEEAVTEVNGELVWSDPKDSQRRSVPYPSFLADAIAERADGAAPDDLLFPSPWGKTIRVRNMRREWFDRAAAEAGVPGLTPHELRHTAASLCVSAGGSVLSLQRMLGHDKPSTTLDVYSDLFDDDLDQLASRLDGLRTKALSPQEVRDPSPIDDSGRSDETEDDQRSA